MGHPHHSNLASVSASMTAAGFHASVSTLGVLHYTHSVGVSVFPIYSWLRHSDSPLPLHHLCFLSIVSVFSTPPLHLRHPHLFKHCIRHTSHLTRLLSFCRRLISVLWHSLFYPLSPILKQWESFHILGLLPPASTPCFLPILTALAECASGRVEIQMPGTSTSGLPLLPTPEGPHLLLRRLPHHLSSFPSAILYARPYALRNNMLCLT